MNKTYQISAQVWLYPGKAGWHFVTIPADISEDIDYYFSDLKKGWGSLKVQVTVGKTHWQTSIFPDRKTNTYLLPIKAKVRVAQHIQAGTTLSFHFQLGSDSR